MSWFDEHFDEYVFGVRLKPKRSHQSKRATKIAPKECHAKRDDYIVKPGYIPEEVIMGMNTVAVQFIGELKNSSQTYNYLTEDDTIKAGDICVVDSPYNGYVCVKVIQVFENRKTPNASKYLICKVDLEGYKAREEKAKRIKELEASLDKHLREHRKMLEWNDLIVTSNEAAQELNELQQLLGHKPTRANPENLSEPKD